MENAIIAEQDKTSLSLLKRDITDGLKIYGEILYKLQLAEKIENSKLFEKAEIIGKEIAEFVTEMIRNFRFEKNEEKKIFLAQEFIT